MTSRRIIAVLSAALASVAPTAYTPTPSSSQNYVLADVVESEMYVTDIDEEQAERAGNRVEIDGDMKVLIDGSTSEEIARVSVEGSAQSRGIVYGNCGSFYFYLYEGAGASYYFTTGFDLNRQAIGYAWFANVRGEYANGSDNFDWDQEGGLAFREAWTSGAVFDNQDSPSGTYHVGRVTSGQAFIPNGEVCSSGYPNAGLVLRR